VTMPDLTGVQWHGPCEPRDKDMLIGDPDENSNGTGGNCPRWGLIPGTNQVAFYDTADPGTVVIVKRTSWNAAMDAIEGGEGRL
jgi:hypothetical protein